MKARRIILYYAWSRSEEIAAPLGVIENRFPTLFESRRMSYPRFEEFSDPARFDQSVAGFLDHIMKRNFAAFLELAGALTDQPVLEIEREAGADRLIALEPAVLEDADTVIIVSFDSAGTDQHATPEEIAAVRHFLERPDHLVFVCPHHDIGSVSEVSHDARLAEQLAHFLHHGDKTIPPQQRFGAYARSLLAGLGVPVENRFGLHPAKSEDGSPAPIEVDSSLDRLHLLEGVPTLNLHAHLPHFERLGAASSKLDVLARQQIDMTAPPHPFTRDGRTTFDAVLQSRANTFGGTLLVGDATLFSSTAGGLESLRRLWRNVLTRPDRH